MPLVLSRLMLVFEYMLHYFYDPPLALIDQVQWNLFTVHTFPQGRSDATNITRTAQFFPCREVEDNFRKSLVSYENPDGMFKFNCKENFTLS